MGEHRRLVRLQAAAREREITIAELWALIRAGSVDVFSIAGRVMVPSVAEVPSARGGPAAPTVRSRGTARIPHLNPIVDRTRATELAALARAAGWSRNRWTAAALAAMAHASLAGTLNALGPPPPAPRHATLPIQVSLDPRQLAVVNEAAQRDGRPTLHWARAALADAELEQYAPGTTPEP